MTTICRNGNCFMCNVEVEAKPKTDCLVCGHLLSTREEAWTAFLREAGGGIQDLFTSKVRESDR